MCTTTSLVSRPISDLFEQFVDPSGRYVLAFVKYGKEIRTSTNDISRPP